MSTSSPSAISSAVEASFENLLRDSQQGSVDSVLGASETGTRADSFSAFWLGGQLFCLDTKLVGEYVEVREVLPVPRAPSAVLGLFNLRGVPLALLDLAVILNLKTSKASRQELRALVIRAADLTLAVVIDRMDAVVSGDWSKIKPLEREAPDSLLAGFLEQLGPEQPPLLAISTTRFLRKIASLSFRHTRTAEKEG